VIAPRRAAGNDAPGLWPLRTVISPGPVHGGQNASDDICSCDLGPGARSHFRRFAGNPDRPAFGRSCERFRCRERHAGACVRLALPSITSLASLVLPASSALKSMSEQILESAGPVPLARRSDLSGRLQSLPPPAIGRWRAMGNNWCASHIRIAIRWAGQGGRRRRVGLAILCAGV
jgi:hypothetical protein